MKSVFFTLAVFAFVAGCCGKWDETIVGEGFSEDKFASIEPSMTEAEVIAVLGDPIANTSRIWTFPLYKVWVYRDEDILVHFKCVDTDYVDDVEPALIYYANGDTSIREDSGMVYRVEEVIRCGKTISKHPFIGKSWQTVESSLGEPDNTEESGIVECLSYTQPIEPLSCRYEIRDVYITGEEKRVVGKLADTYWD